MPRRPRSALPPGVHHVTARGNNREVLFRDTRDRTVFLRLLGEARAELGLHPLAYCLMDNHYHLLVDAAPPVLSRGMQHVNGRYVRYVNLVHGRVGHVFERRFNTVHVADQRQLAAVVRYIARNPVAAGLCDRPEAWPWNSARLLTSGAREEPSPWLDRARLREYVGHEPARLWADDTALPDVQVAP
jgi:REP element-mobilizing transposase RayT